MKVAFVLVLAFAAVMATTDDDRKEEIKKANEKCNSVPETTLHKEDIAKWRKDGGPEPATMGAHALCMSKELGMQDAEGHLLKEAMEAKIRAHAPADKADAITKDCLVEKDTDVETAKHLFKCFLEVIRKGHSAASA